MKKSKGPHVTEDRKKSECGIRLPFTILFLSMNKKEGVSALAENSRLVLGSWLRHTRIWRTDKYLGFCAPLRLACEKLFILGAKRLCSGMY